MNLLPRKHPYRSQKNLLMKFEKLLILLHEPTKNTTLKMQINPKKN